MKVTEHALKRLALLTMDSHSQKEVIFFHRYILPGAKIIQWNHGIHVDDIPLFASRCHNFGGWILGLETWFYSPYALYTFAYEDYSDTHNDNWYHKAIVELYQAKVMDMIIPTVTFPKQVLEKYIG